MSAMGHKQTLESGSGMSALPPKADMFSVEIDVCFVPIADSLSPDAALPTTMSGPQKQGRSPPASPSTQG